MEQTYLLALDLQRGQRNLEVLGFPWTLEGLEFQGGQNIQDRLDLRMAQGDPDDLEGLGGLGIRLEK